MVRPTATAAKVLGQTTSPAVAVVSSSAPAPPSALWRLLRAATVVLGAVFVLHVVRCLLYYPPGPDADAGEINSVGNPTNMNPEQPYLVANALSGRTSFAHAPALSKEHFTVYSPPLRSRYSEVFWKVLPAVPLPADIVTRYNSSAMAVTGFEVDVVRIAEDGTETSVPCYESYNHHYVSFIHGRGATLDTDSGQYHSHGASSTRTPAAYEQVRFTANGHTAGLPADLPAVQAFSEHNGNEARQSYHGLPVGYVQPIVAPQNFVFGPMQINTKSPSSASTGSGRCTAAHPCPLPRSSKAPVGAAYSGLLECPCTTRTVFKANPPTTRTTATCAKLIATAAQCFQAAASLQIRPIVANTTVSTSTMPPSCSVTYDNGTYTATYNGRVDKAVDCGTDTSAPLSGTSRSLVDVQLTVMASTSTVSLTLTGPSDVWFAVGIGHTQMANTYAIVVDGNGTVTEHLLDNHAPGTQLPPSITTTHHTVVNNQRRVTVTRDMAGHDSRYYSFTTSPTVPYINAIGTSAVFQMHKDKTVSSLALTRTAAKSTTCVCGGEGGSINGVPYSPHCAAYPKSDLLVQKNPTCSVDTYVGGMACCRGGVFLLDADQDVPAEEDEVFYKWRFYFEDWDVSKHTPTIHLEWQFGHIEYDVTAAASGTAPRDAVHMLTSRFTLRDMMDQYGKPGCDPVTDYYCADTKKVTSRGVGLVMAGGHCHAPACLSLELINVDTGQLVCHIEPVHGQGDDTKDEQGYLWLPPCQWGSSEEGLSPPPVMHLDTNFMAIKRANSSVYHYGVMAIFQMRGVYL